jgi:hypothetical protein
VAGKLVNTKLGGNQYNGTDGKFSAEKAALLLGVSVASIKRAKKVFDKGAPEIVEALEKGKLRLGMAVGVVAKPKEKQAQAVQEAKTKAETAKKEAKAKRDAAKAGKPAKKEPEANLRMIELDAFKKKWEGFNDMQQRSFVEEYRDGLQTILQKIAEHEAYRHAAE